MDSDALARECAARGMRWAFGLPGGGPSLQFIDGLMRAGVNYLTTGHETTAALMAGAAARALAKPSAAIAIKGPGLMNLTPGLLSNAYEGYAMLSLSEAYAANAPGSRRHKWLEHRKLLEPFVKSYAYCATGASIPIERAWQHATAEFPGPVHLELVNGEDLQPSEHPGAADEIADTLGKIRAATRPAVIVGSWGLRASWRARLAELKVPVFSTVSAKGVISEQSLYAAGVYTGDGKTITPEKVVLPSADLIVTLGVRAGEILEPRFPNPNCLRIDSTTVRHSGVFPAPATGGEVHYLDDASVVTLLDALQEKSWGADDCTRSIAAMDQALSDGWSPVQAYRRVSETLPDVAHVLDTGNFTVVGEHVLRSATEHDVLGTPNGRYMGFGIGYALGTAVARPERPVALWIGDGGIRAFFSELSLAIEQRMKLLVMVMADGYFGSIRGRAQQQGWTLAPLRMEGRDLRRVADAMGFSTVAVANETSLGDALATWRSSPAPTMIRCDFDGEAYGNVAGLLR